MVVFPLVKNCDTRNPGPRAVSPRQACNASAICRKYNAARLFAVLRPRPTGDDLGTRRGRVSSRGGRGAVIVSLIRESIGGVIILAISIILAVPCTVILHVQPKYNSMVSYELRPGTAAVRRVGQTQRSWVMAHPPGAAVRAARPTPNEASTSKCAISASSSAHV